MDAPDSLDGLAVHLLSDRCRGDVVPLLRFRRTRDEGRRPHAFDWGRGPRPPETLQSIRCRFENTRQLSASQRERIRRQTPPRGKGNRHLPLCPRAVVQCVEIRGGEQGWCGTGEGTGNQRRPLNKVKNASPSPLAIEGGYAARRAYSKRPRLSTGKLVAFRLMKLW